MTLNIWKIIGYFILFIIYSKNLVTFYKNLQKNVNNQTHQSLILLIIVSFIKSFYVLILVYNPYFFINSSIKSIFIISLFYSIMNFLILCNIHITKIKTILHFKNSKSRSFIIIIIILLGLLIMKILLFFVYLLFLQKILTICFL